MLSIRNSLAARHHSEKPQLVTSSQRIVGIISIWLSFDRLFMALIFRTLSCPLPCEGRISFKAMCKKGKVTSYAARIMCPERCLCMYDGTENIVFCYARSKPPVISIISLHACRV